MATLRYAYDSLGNLISYKQLNPKGELVVHQKRTYNNKNQNLELYNLNKKTGLYYLSAQYQYNEKGLYTSIKNYNAAGNLIHESKYAYNKGKLATLTSIREGKENKTTYKYNNEGRVSVVTHDAKRYINLNGKKRVLKQWEEHFSYDAEGNLLRKITKNNNAIFATEKYFYEKHSF